MAVYAVRVRAEGLGWTPHRVIRVMDVRLHCAGLHMIIEHPWNSRRTGGTFLALEPVALPFVCSAPSSMVAPMRIRTEQGSLARAAMHTPEPAELASLFIVLSPATGRAVQQAQVRGLWLRRSLHTTVSCLPTTACLPATMHWGSWGSCAVEPQNILTNGIIVCLRVWSCKDTHILHPLATASQMQNSRFCKFETRRNIL